MPNPFGGPQFRFGNNLLGSRVVFVPRDETAAIKGLNLQYTIPSIYLTTMYVIYKDFTDIFRRRRALRYAVAPVVFVVSFSP